MVVLDESVIDGNIGSSLDQHATVDAAADSAMVKPQLRGLCTIVDAAGLYTTVVNFATEKVIPVGWVPHNIACA